MPSSRRMPTRLLPVKPTIIKPFVDFLLYFVSFRIQQAWVFKPVAKKETEEQKEA